MQYLLLAVLSIIIYAEVLPTISILFELVRTYLAAKIAIIQQDTVYVQEDIQNVQAKMEQTNTNAIGFQIPVETEMEDDYESHHKAK